MPNFEIYQRTASRRFHGQAVTITARGVISFSKEAYDLLGQPEAVKLLYDKDERIIGFQHAEREAKNSYTVRLQGRYTRAVSAVAFCKCLFALGILRLGEYSAKRWPLTLEDGIGCIDLKQSGTPVTSSRRRKKERV